MWYRRTLRTDMKKYSAFILAFLAVAVCTWVSCNKDNQKDIDQSLIEDYLENHGLTAESTSSGLHYIIIEPGNNEHPSASSTIDFIYTGKFLNDQVFDSSEGLVVTYPLNGLIEGFKEGIPLLGKGGRAKLLVPSHLGYGENPPSGIPLNAVLVFDVELVDF